MTNDYWWYAVFWDITLRMQISSTSWRKPEIMQVIIYYQLCNLLDSALYITLCHYNAGTGFYT